MLFTYLLSFAWRLDYLMVNQDLYMLFVDLGFEMVCLTKVRFEHILFAAMSFLGTMLTRQSRPSILLFFNLFQITEQGSFMLMCWYSSSGIFFFLWMFMITCFHLSPQWWLAFSFPGSQDSKSAVYILTVGRCCIVFVYCCLDISTFPPGREKVQRITYGSMQRLPLSMAQEWHDACVVCRTTWCSIPHACRPQRPNTYRTEDRAHRFSAGRRIWLTCLI